MPPDGAWLQQYVAECGCTWDVIINTANAIVYCSSTCEAITGYTPETFLRNDRCIESIIHPEDRKHGPTRLACGLPAADHRSTEYRIIAGNGEVKWLASFIKPIRQEDDRPASILISSIDITPYREKTRQLEQENDRLNRHNQELIRRLSSAFDDINNKENDVVVRNRALEQTNRELIEANNALRVLARNLDQIKRSTEERLLNDIYKHIYPLIIALKSADTPASLKKMRENLLYRIGELCRTLAGGDTNDLKRYLSATEIKVAAMIKDGLNSSDIAGKLKLSVATVKTHRKNIRRKLKIQHSSINLASYLKLKWHPRF